MEKNRAVFIIIDKKTNPLKGALSFYNFYLGGEISRLIYENQLSLNKNNQIILYKNEESKLIPEKIIFFVNFDETLESTLKQTIKSLKIDYPIIIK